MTSPLTSRSLDRLSVWIVWAQYAVDDYVIIWSNLNKNWRRRSILKGVMTSWGHVTSSVTSPFESPRPLSYRLPIVTYLLAPFFRDIWPQSCGQTHTHPQNFTSTDNKGPLKLSAREPITLSLCSLILTERGRVLLSRWSLIKCVVRSTIGFLTNSCRGHLVCFNVLNFFDQKMFV